MIQLLADCYQEYSVHYLRTYEFTYFKNGII